MSSLLLVPIHLDALMLWNHGTFVGPAADFTRLPYIDGEHEVNAEVAYVSENVVARPFKNENLYLKAGVHLHWALPDALTRGSASSDGKTAFPTVPNRWLVTRSVFGKKQKEWIVESDYLYPEGAGRNAGSVNILYEPSKDERQPFRYLGRNMLLETWLRQDSSASCYFKPLTAIGYGEPTFSAFYPNCHSVFGFHDDDDRENLKGLCYDVIGWYSSDTYESKAANDESQDFLTRFVQQRRAAYPHERAPELISALERRIGWSIASEDLISWYSPDKKTQLNEILTKIKEDYKAANLDPPSASSFLKEVEDRLKLGVEKSSNLTFPAAIVCYASLTFEPDDKSKRDLSVAPISVAMGASGTEALSSVLAQTIDPNHKSKMEDQLEALLLSDHLEHRQLDLGFKFDEARHEKGFTAVAGGSLWTITQETFGSPTPANASDLDAIREIALPTKASQLNALNRLQQEYDLSVRRIESNRSQLFSDWYKYMLCSYPSDDSRHRYPNADRVKHYIQTKVLNPLKNAIDATGTLQLQNDASGAVTSARAFQSSEGSLATRLALAINEMLRSLDFDSGVQIQDLLKYKVTAHSIELLVAKFPQTHLEALKTLSSKAPLTKTEFLELVEKKIGKLSDADRTKLLKATQAVAFRLKLKPAPRFWRPNEPVVLIWGAAAEATDRHGQDGSMRQDDLVVCHVLPDADLNNLVRDRKFEVISRRIQEIRNHAKSSSFAFDTWTGNPWNPLLVEWEAEVFPVLTLGNLRSNTAGYSRDFITSNYILANNSVDLISRLGLGELTKARNTYSGSSILTPHASYKFEQELEEFFIEFMEPALLKKFYDDQSILEKDRGETFLLKHFPQLVKWYLANSDVLLQFYKYSHRASDVEKNAVWLRKNTTIYVKWALEQIDLYATFSDHAKINVTLQLLKKDKDRAEQFIAWLKSQIWKLELFYEDLNVPKDKQSAYLREYFETLVSWYQRRVQRDLQMVVMLLAYHTLEDSHFLSQSLGGFNHALLMHKQMMQLPIADPLGFQEDRDFANAVKALVGNRNRRGTQPGNDFNPILSGAMKLKKLRIIDTFGQVLDVDCKTIIGTKVMQTFTSESLLTLPPRVVQPCRLNFRWLSAADNQEEMNDHPGTRPVCGWFLPNHLTGGLEVFDHEGSPLGSITVSKGWEGAPRSSIEKIDQIPNVHLRRMVHHLHNHNEAGRRDFIVAIESALEDIEPENFAQHPELTVLIGRPFALVRASLQWQLLGEPAIDQSWEALHLDLFRRSRGTDRFTSIEFLVRLGAHRQMNDGLIGYWVESGVDYENNRFHAPKSNAVLLAFGDAPKVISMLIDPRGIVHATSGIVPTKVIDIPPDQYTAALSAIQATFFTGPVLTPAKEINLPLPEEAGYRWSWLEKQDRDWPEQDKIGVASAQAEFRGEQELREGWLKLNKIEKTP